MMKPTIFSNIKLLTLLLSSFWLTACANSSPDNTIKAQCFWMENYSGKYHWVDTNTIYQKKLTKAECFQLDSCDGGMGQSGGCYKWANSPDAERAPWD